MSKPDFLRMTVERLSCKQVYMDGRPYTRQFGEVFAAALEEAYAAGLERAAEICDEMEGFEYGEIRAANAIRAEKDETDE
jgi:hypothetical protein